MKSQLNQSGQSMRPNVTEKRQHSRIGTRNLVSYVLCNDKGAKIHKGKGYTLNLSQSGVMLATDKPLDGVFIILMAIDLEGKKLKVNGTVAHTKSDAASGRYLSGIKFIGPEDEQREAIIAFVKVYQHHKHLAKQRKEGGEDSTHNASKSVF